MQEAIRDALVWMLGFGVVTTVYLAIGLTLIRRWRQRKQSVRQPAPPSQSDEPAHTDATGSSG
ncbi:MAG: hypothetical protein KJ000_06355 [Pirellulaceae bacterium]|nr:hypothetical protein [Pirellulaceae bacterium]